MHAARMRVANVGVWVATHGQVALRSAVASSWLLCAAAWLDRRLAGILQIGSHGRLKGALRES